MKIVLVGIFLFTTTQCGSDFNRRPKNFTTELFSYAQLETNGDVVVSPFGVWTLMTGVTLGASKDSRCQLTKAFSLPSQPELLIDRYTNLTRAVLHSNTTGATLISKNFMFLDKSFNIKDDFRKIITNNFSAIIQTLDFKKPKTAAKDANDIIQNTGVNVSNVLRSNDFAKSRMILTNVISFKGFWTTPFNETDTQVEPFYDEHMNEIGKVNMMALTAYLPYSNVEEMKATILELPYGDDEKYCMLLVMPYPKTKVSYVYQKLATVSFTEILERLQSNVDAHGLFEISVKLPRFKISTNVVLNKPLNNMGVHDIFDPKLANFENMTSEKIFVSAIVHKADIEVTETGTIASAITSAELTNRISTPNYHANRPFIYFVMEKPTATVIFNGIYYKPSLY